MKRKIRLFTKATLLLGGYNLALKDDWGEQIRYMHISEEQKELYVKTFGEILITESKFLEWSDKYFKKKIDKENDQD